MSIGSSSTIVFALGGGCGAIDTWGGSTGSVGRKATTLESHEAWLPSGIFGGVRRTIEAFLGLFIFFSCPTIRGGGGADEDSISASEGDREATSEAVGVGSECSDGGTDPNRTPDEDEADSLDIFLKKKKELRSQYRKIQKPKNIPTTLNYSKNRD